MKAIVVESTGGPEALSYVEREAPEPGPGQVRVRVAFAGVNFIDIYQRSGQYKVATPFTPGSEGAGVVEAVGEGVRDVTAGSRVAWPQVAGSYATHVLAKPESLVPVPDGVTLETAAALMLQGLTAHYLTHDTFRLEKEHTCLIHAAAGGVGLLFVQLAKARGARVLGTAGSDEKAELAKKAGADEVIVYSRQDFLAETKRLTSGHGVSVVYDSVGKDTFDRSLQCLHPRGTLVLFGQSSGAVPPLELSRLAQGGSLFVTRPTLVHYLATRTELLSRAQDLFDAVVKERLDVRVGRSFPLEAAADAHRALAGRETTGKVLLAMPA